MFAPAGNRFKSILLFFALGFFGYFPDGYSGSFVNTAVDSFREFYNKSYVDRGYENGLSDSAWTWLWSITITIWFPGYLLGCLLTPVLADRYGRRMTLIIANCMALFGTSLTLLALQFEVPELFIIGYGILSIGPGMSFVGVVLFCQEVASTDIRALAVSLSENAYVACCLLGVVFGMQSVLGNFLKILTGICIPPSIIALVLISFMHDSPKYLLINRNDRKRALKAIEYYQGSKHDNDKLLDAILLEARETEPTENGIYFLIQVFKISHLRRPFFVGVASMQVVTTMVVFQAFSTEFLKNHFSSDMAQSLSFCMVAAMFSGGFIGMSMIEKIGRRPLFLINFGVSIVSLLAYIICDRVAFTHHAFKWPLVASMTVFFVVFGLALSPIAFSITTEMVVQKHRSFVQTMVFSTATIFNFAIGFFILPAFTKLTSLFFIPLFIVPAIVCWIYLYFKMPETRGREVHEVVAEMLEVNNKNQKTVEKL